MDVREKLVELPVDDAILILKEEHRQRIDGYTTHLAYGGKGDPAEEVSLDALAMAISALEQTRWISVKNRLPEDGEIVLCNTKHRETMVLQKDSHKYYTWVSDQASYIVSYVTHWMPLPKPPKEE